jgi:hypothetical protein
VFSVRIMVEKKSRSRKRTVRLCVCVCVCVCACTYTYVRACGRGQVQVCIYVSVCMYVCTYVYMYACIYIWVNWSYFGSTVPFAGRLPLAERSVTPKFHTHFHYTTQEGKKSYKNYWEFHLHQYYIELWSQFDVFFIWFFYKLNLSLTITSFN